MSDKKTPEIAFDYHRSLRDEINERYKMRDTIMIAYLGPTAALFGVAFGKDLKPIIEHPVLLLLLPFLALGACSMVTLHQDQSTAYYQYFVTELRKCMAPDDQRVTPYYMSDTAHQHTRRINRVLFASQLLLLCGPAVVWHTKNSRCKNANSITGVRVVVVRLRTDEGFGLTESRLTIPRRLLFPFCLFRQIGIRRRLLIWHALFFLY